MYKDDEGEMCRVGCVKASRGQHVFHTPMTPDTPDSYLFPYSDETMEVFEYVRSIRVVEK
jgi:hypothetical protein